MSILPADQVASRIRIAHNRRRNASLPGDHAQALPPAICRACGASYVKYRTWQVFCSPKCRKAKWLDAKATEIPSDIRATLNRIESRLSAIESKLDQIIRGDA